MTSRTIDLNSDIGEMIGDNFDHEIIRLVSSVNISCGVHAGSLDLTAETIRQAAKVGVAIGAHPGMPGQFGRNELLVSATDAFSEVQKQLLSFLEIAEECGAAMTHVKPHGSLYNQAEIDHLIAEAVVDAITATAPAAAVYGLAGGQLLRVADKRGLRTVGEFFADRSYQEDGTLTSRSSLGAVLSSPDDVTARTVRALIDGEVTTSKGSRIKRVFQSICVHGDSPASVQMIKQIRSTLQSNGFVIEQAR